MPSSARSTRSCAAAALAEQPDDLGLRRPRLGPAPGRGEAAREQAPALDVVGTLGEDGCAAARSAPRPRRRGRRPASLARDQRLGGGLVGGRRGRRAAGRAGRASRARGRAPPRRRGRAPARAPRPRRDSRRGAAAAGASAASASAAASSRRETSVAAGGGLARGSARRGRGRPRPRGAGRAGAARRSWRGARRGAAPRQSGASASPRPATATSPAISQKSQSTIHASRYRGGPYPLGRGRHNARGVARVRPQAKGLMLLTKPSTVNRRGNEG